MDPDVAQDAALEPGIFREVWSRFGDQVERCRSGKCFQRIGNVIYGYLVDDAQPRFSEKGAGKLVSIFLENSVYARLNRRINAVPYKGPFSRPFTTEEPRMRLTSSPDGRAFFELRIKEEITEDSMEELVELIALSASFIKKRRRRLSRRLSENAALSDVRP